MSEGPLGPEARALIMTAREAEAPSAHDRLRVRRALAMQIGAGGLGLLAGKQAAAGLLGGTAVKVSLAVAVIAAAGVLIGTRSRELPAPPATSAPAPVLPHIEPLPPAPAPAQPPRATRPARVVTREKKSPPPVRLAEETAYLAAARDALRSGDAARALRLLEDYPSQFPAAVLLEEHMAARVFTLRELGRRDEACRAARAFLRRWPRSLQASRVQAACEPR